MMYLAEISDKMESAWGWLLVGAVFAMPFALLAYWWRWFIIAAVPAFAWLNYELLAELSETGFGEAIIKEMSWAYVVVRPGALCVGFAVPIAVARVACWHANRIGRGEAGLCMACGYPLNDLLTCPECGRAR